MKTTYKAILTTACAFCLASLSNAATIINQSPSGTGTGYHWLIDIGQNESVSTVGNGHADVGIWSWDTTSSPGNAWTHTSDFARINLTEASTMTIVMGRNASIPNPAPGSEGTFLPSDALYPSFTIWGGNLDYAIWSTTHFFANTGDGVLGLLDVAGFVNNTTAETAELQLTLDAGVYTVLLGGNGPQISGPNQGYYATFSTAPVPEPSTGLLIIGASFLFLSRRRH